MSLLKLHSGIADSRIQVPVEYPSMVVCYDK